MFVQYLLPHGFQCNSNIGMMFFISYHSAKMGKRAALNLEINRFAVNQYTIHVKNDRLNDVIIGRFQSAKLLVCYHVVFLLQDCVYIYL
ncbi:hypothetical protein D3C76_1490960 [compost metagenome]